MKPTPPSPSSPRAPYALYDTAQDFLIGTFATLAEALRAALVMLDADDTETLAGVTLAYEDGDRARTILADAALAMQARAVRPHPQS
jgi:hypothetical protein